MQGQSSFSIVREALRIPLPVFWLRTSPNNFYQNFRSANIPNKEIEYQNSYLSRRHVVAGKVNQGGSDSNRYSVFLVATSRIYNQPQKVHSDSPAKNRVFRSASRFSQHVIVFDSRETDESDQPMFGDVQNRESVHFTIDKAYRSFRFNNTRSVPAQPQFRYLQQIQVESLSRDPSYQHQVTLISSAKQELLWSVQNLKLCNGRCLVQPQAQMVI